MSPHLQTSLATLSLLAAAACVSPMNGAPEPPSAPGKADGVGDAIPWGGPDPESWAPEAVLANAASARLGPDVVVSIPVHLEDSQIHPFGDGQSNVAASLVFWEHERPPVVGVRSGLGDELAIHFDRELPNLSGSFEIFADGSAIPVRLVGEADAEGDWHLSSHDASLLGAEDLLVRPQGWAEGFPLSFRVPEVAVEELAASLPEGSQTLPGGEPVVDPVGARSQLGDPAGTSAAILEASSFPEGFINQAPFVSSGVHAEFPGSRVTAVGAIASWVALSPLKNVYASVEGRRPEREVEHGVPSGAGWHRIGDAGESILNSLELVPLMVAYAKGEIAELPQPVSGHAYGLDRSAVFTLLQPGRALVSRRGDSHWFAIDQLEDVSFQIWTHRCEPDTSRPSMSCP